MIDQKEATSKRRRKPVPRGPLTAKPAVTEADLRAALRTAAMMAECYLHRVPQLAPPKRGGTDRTNENALRQFVETMRQAARRQREQRVRVAQLALRDTLADTVRVHCLGQELEKNRHGRPKARSGYAPSPKDSSRAERVRFEVDLACSEYEFAAVDPIPEESRAQVVASILDVTPTSSRLGWRGPVLFCNDLMPLLVEAAADTVEKRDAERRHDERRENQPLYGESGMFFGATSAPSPLSIAESMGGRAFIVAALGWMPPDDALRCALAAYENGRLLSHMAMLRAAVRDHGSESAAAEVAKLEPVHAAVAQLAVALGGSREPYDDVSDTLTLNAGTAYPGSDLMHHGAAFRWAKGGWADE